MVIEGAHLVGAGGALGAMVRYGLGQQVTEREIPWGTVLVNLGGSFLLALLTILAVDSRFMLLLGTGACGAFTTFSSFSVETMELWESGQRWTAVAYAGGTFAGAMGAMGLAWPVAALIRSLALLV